MPRAPVGGLHNMLLLVFPYTFGDSAIGGNAETPTNPDTDGERYSNQNWPAGKTQVGEHSLPSPRNRAVFQTPSLRKQLGVLLDCRPFVRRYIKHPDVEWQVSDRWS